jgi:Domain of unknown function (DUF2431)
MELLILGDGNFSFSLALAKNLKRYVEFLGFKDDQINMTLTSFDSRAQLLKKYHDFKDILPQLLSLPVQLLHGINAWELSTHFDKNFDLIMWNHPHLGTEDFKLHR